MALKELINLIEIDENVTIGIKSQAFVDSIQKLDNMVGLTKIKTQFAKHLKHAMKQCELGENLNNYHNIIITGGPGRGKTQLAENIGNTFITMGFFSRNQFIEDDLDYTIPLNEFIKIMKTFKKNSITYQEFKRKKSGRTHVDFKHRKKINRKLANLCISRSLFGNVPFFSKDNSNVYINDIINGKYNDSSKEIFEDFDINYLPDDNKLPFIGKCKVFSKDDLVASYVGQTGPKTLKALKECKGGVFILDECYALLNLTSKSDRPCSFGIEALNKLNLYLSQHQNEQMVIFCGYKDFVSYLYDNQKGLRRRFKTIYDIDDYSTNELIEIFFQKLPPRIMQEIPNMKIFKNKFEIEAKKYKFPHQAGDMETLSQILTIEFDWINEKSDKKINEIIENSLKELEKKHKEEGSIEKDSVCINHIYL